LIEVDSSVVIRSSPETVWRHLTRVGEWPRWYPGLHGVDTSDPVTSIGFGWRMSGQIGRMLYRSNNQVTGYELLHRLEISGDRRPWISQQVLAFDLTPEGHNCRLNVALTAQPGVGLAGRVLLTGPLRRRLRAEIEDLCQRFSRYIERALPHH
jgi:uncharacterized protein YndB with AHSA1/START domain